MTTAHGTGRRASQPFRLKLGSASTGDMFV
jgi:hypothetical protein